MFKQCPVLVLHGFDLLFIIWISRKFSLKHNCSHYKHGATLYYLEGKLQLYWPSRHMKCIPIIRLPARLSMSLNAITSPISMNQQTQPRLPWILLVYFSKTPSNLTWRARLQLEPYHTSASTLLCFFLYKIHKKHKSLSFHTYEAITIFLKPFNWNFPHCLSFLKSKYSVNNWGRNEFDRFQLKWNRLWLRLGVQMGWRKNAVKRSVGHLRGIRAQKCLW